MKKRDFFISYSNDNLGWATWIAGTLERKGYSVYLQEWDICPGDNFISKMNMFISNSKNYIAVLSHSFQNSRYCQLEYQAALNAFLNKQIHRFIPIRIDDVNLESICSAIVYVDLFGLNEEQAEFELLRGIRHTPINRLNFFFPKKIRTSVHNYAYPSTYQTESEKEFPSEQYAEDKDMNDFWEGFDEEVTINRLIRPSERE